MKKMKNHENEPRRQSFSQRFAESKTLLLDGIRRIKARKDELLSTPRGRRIALASLAGLVLAVVIIIVALASCRGGDEAKIPAGGTDPGTVAVLPKLGTALASLNLTPAPVDPAAPEKLTLSGNGHTLVFHADSAAADLDGIPVALPGNAEIAPDGSWTIPEDAVSDLLQPILSGSRIPVRTIVIDPGHGGDDRGASTAIGHREKDLNFLLALELAKELRQAGFQVALTRTGDRFVSLDQRPDFAAKQKADLFVSIHHNASANNPDAAGPEVYVMAGKTPEQNAVSAKSCFTAFAMCQEFRSSEILPVRGVKRADFKVLRLSACPAVLVEAGFLTNPTEANRLVTSSRRRAIASALAAAIIRSVEKK